MRWLLLLIAIALFTLDALSSFAQTATADHAADSGQESETATADGGAPADEEPSYLRVEKNDAGRPRALQTAVVRFEGRPGTRYEGRTVDLVGVVHIGQRDYYEELNRRLGTYDRVLYELVAPDGTRFTPEDLEKRRSVLGSMQSGMKDLLNLEYQLELVDYMAENFRHADMSPDEFAEDLERRGDSIWKMFARMMGAGLASQTRAGGDAGLLLALFSEDRAKRMKQTMARQLVELELVTAGINDAKGDNTLIKGRNAKAFQILREELSAGHDELAVFYGAGHLPDMAERLEKDFDMQPTETVWLDAWDLTRN